MPGTPPARHHDHALRQNALQWIHARCGDGGTALRPAAVGTLKLSAPLFDPAAVPRIQSFQLSPIKVCKRRLLRELYTFPRVAARGVSRELRLVSSEAAHRVSHTAQRAWRRISPKARRKRRRARRLPAEDTAQSLITHALECQKALDLQGALVALERARRLEPSNAKVLTLASKQWTDHTYIDGMQRADVLRVNAKAIELAARAQRADPAFSLAHSVECICRGRLAEHERSPTRVLQHAKDAQTAVFRALECDADDDLAHHLIGRFNAGMATLNFMVRGVVKCVFGSDFRPGTLANAEESYLRAIALRPDRLVHKVELARVYSMTNRKDEAVALLPECFQMQPEDINARQMLQEASALLVKLDRNSAAAPAHLLDTTFVVSALADLVLEGPELVRTDQDASEETSVAEAAR